MTRVGYHRFITMVASANIFHRDDSPPDPHALDHDSLQGTALPCARQGRLDVRACATPPRAARASRLGSIHGDRDGRRPPLEDERVAREVWPCAPDGAREGTWRERRRRQRSRAAGVQRIAPDATAES